MYDWPNNLVTDEFPNHDINGVLLENLLFSLIPRGPGTTSYLYDLVLVRLSTTKSYLGPLLSPAVKLTIITSHSGNVMADQKVMACRYLNTFDYKRSHGS